MTRHETKIKISWGDTSRTANLIQVDGDDYETAFNRSHRGRDLPLLTRMTGGRWKPKAWSTEKTQNIFVHSEYYDRRHFARALADFFGVGPGWSLLIPGIDHRGLKSAVVTPAEDNNDGESEE